MQPIEHLLASAENFQAALIALSPAPSFLANILVSIADSTAELFVGMTPAHVHSTQVLDVTVESVLNVDPPVWGTTLLPLLCRRAMP